MSQQTDRAGTLALIKEMLVTESHLEFLRGLDDASLQTLRKEIEAYIHRTEEMQKPLFKVMSIATKFMPNFIIAKIGKEYLTPYVLAQISLYMEPKDAANIGKLLPNEILAEVALYSPPHLTAVIADKMGVSSVIKIMEAMIAREFYHRLGEVSDELALPMLTQLTQKLQATDIANIVVYMKDRQRVRQASSGLASSKKNEIAARLQTLQADAELVEIYRP